MKSTTNPNTVKDTSFLLLVTKCNYSST